MPTLRTSIALATYQGERFLPQQLESFLGQTRRPDELCISDDGSTDETLDIIRAFASSAPFPVKCVANPVRGGVNKNFENAVSHCTGEVILFSDQDDVWLPQHIEGLVAPMEGNSGIVALRATVSSSMNRCNWRGALKHNPIDFPRPCATRPCGSRGISLNWCCGKIWPPDMAWPFVGHWYRF